MSAGLRGEARVRRVRRVEWGGGREWVWRLDWVERVSWLAGVDCGEGGGGGGTYSRTVLGGPCLE